MKQLVAFLVALSVSFGSAGLADAGSTTGAGVYREIAPARGVKVIFERYAGNQLAVLDLIGDGDTDLDIYVYDQAGRLVASGVGLTDRERVSFVPSATGSYRIEIRNLGNVFNRFQLHTN